MIPVTQQHTIISPGPIRNWEVTPYGITGHTEDAIFAIQVYADHTIRVQVSRHEAFSPNPYAVIAKPVSGLFEFRSSPDILWLSTKKMTVTISRECFSLSFATPQGKVLCEDDPAIGINWLGTEVSCYKKLQPWEKFIGLGEKTGGLNRWGKAYTNWNTDSFGYGIDADPLYLSVPFYIGLNGGKAYGIFFDNPHKSVFNFGASNNRFSYFSAEDGDLDYYFFHEDSVASIIQAYTQLTGRMEMPPLWSLGYQQCRYSYYPDREVLRLAETFREKEIPADVIYLDIHHMEKYKVFTFDGKTFPDPAAMIKSLKERGFKVVVILDPGIKNDPNYAPYLEGIEQGLFIRYPDQVPYEGHVWPGWCAFPDFTNPAARAWWANKLSFYSSLGVDGFWTDMNEPATWGQHMPNIIEFHFEGEQCSHRKARNIYGMQMARSTREGSLQHADNKRPFVLSRSGYAGIQRDAAVWTGDNVASDEHMLAGIRLVNSLGLSGVSFSGFDVGGFAGNTNPKLFARWISLGAFSPLFRAHSMINSNDSEPWSFGEEVEEIAKNYIRLRYKLLPTIYAAFYKSCSSGLPVAKSLAIDYAFDDRVFQGPFDNQYLFCDKFLVVPVESFRPVTKVFLPEGKWYYLFNSQPVDGNQVCYWECPLSYLPVFVKAGSIVALQEPVNHTGEAHDGILHLHVYHGSGTSNHLHYEDDGSTLDYRNNAYFKRNLLFDHSHKVLIFEESRGNYKSKFHTVKIYFHGFGENQASVGEVMKKLEKEDVSFLDRISDFDPFPDNRHPYHQCEDTRTLTIPHPPAKLTITLH
ncbi:Alpha-glucosidase [Lunatimonas lonarensis]|uniref:Alpha-glucosidase n=1 Tax=Lunatimonas lonarensis TaxID=1232681 RepID=R7ZMW6_9BACT|nr:TIM-barrel domain-containing protein [Lunatimonas lonarensis]EON75428.1 Alpha-glucosidase [Lunatimonas lonarensis]